MAELTQVGWQVNAIAQLVITLVGLVALVPGWRRRGGLSTVLAVIGTLLQVPQFVVIAMLDVKIFGDLYGSETFQVVNVIFALGGTLGLALVLVALVVVKASPQWQPGQPPAQWAPGGAVPTGQWGPGWTPGAGSPGGQRGPAGGSPTGQPGQGGGSPTGPGSGGGSTER